MHQTPPSYGQGHQQAHGYYPQGPGLPPPKKGMGTGTILLIVFGCLFGGCAAMCGIASKAQVKGAEAREMRQAKQQEAASVALPWTTNVKANCAAYQAAPNEIKKSAVFNSNQQLLSGVSLQGVQGKLKRLSTNQGGGNLDLKIEVGDVEFTSRPLSPIKRGSAIYDAATEMSVGQCVTVSATNVSASSMVEQSKVCDLEYFVDFASLAPCQ